MPRGMVIVAGVETAGNALGARICVPVTEDGQELIDLAGEWATHYRSLPEGTGNIWVWIYLEGMDPKGPAVVVAYLDKEETEPVVEIVGKFAHIVWAFGQPVEA